MYPILFSIAGLHIYSFSVFLIFAWCVWSFLFWRHVRDEGVDEDKIFTVMFWATLTAFAAGRMGFVAVHWNLFADNLLKIAALWVQPGLSLYAALLAGLAFFAVSAKKMGIRLGYVIDGLGVSLAWALLVGSIGSLLDGSEVGKMTTVSWGIRYIGHVGSRHPVQLYTVTLLFLIGIAVVRMAKRARTDRWPYGMIGVWFFLLFAPASFGVEFFKENTLYLQRLSANQWILLGLFAEAFGAFYVRGGGREKFIPWFTRVKERIRTFIPRRKI